MKRKMCILMIILLTLTSFNCVLADKNVYINNGIFIDVSTNHWANEAIESMSNRGIINGYEDGTFKPEAYLSREEFAKLITLTFGMEIEDVDIPTFSDVDKSSWSYKYIETSKEYLTGYFPPKGRPFFDPFSNATREDVAVALTRAMGINDENIDANSLLRYTFTDYEEISPRLRVEVASAIKHGLIKGYPDGTFRPNAPIDRASTATLLYRVLKSSYATASKDVELSLNVPEKVSTKTVRITGKTNKDAKVYIDDEEVYVNNGKFDALFELVDGEGVYEFEIKVVLPNGKKRIERRNVKYEQGAPVLTVNCPETANKSEVKITGKVTDSSDRNPKVTVNGKEVYVSYNGEWNVNVKLKEGQNKLNIVAKNRNNKKTKIEKIITFNMEAPQIIIENLPEKTTNKVITISGRAVDSNDNNPNVYINDQKVTYNYSYGQFSKQYTLNEGENIFTIKAVNNMGKSITVTRKVVLDVTGPQIDINIPDISNKRNINITGKVTDNYYSYDKLTLSINGCNIPISYSGYFSHNMELVDGQNMITIVATNPSGKQTKINKVINFTILPPKIDVTIPEKTNYDNISISGKIIDEMESYPILTVNGESVYVSSNGNFNVNISLNEGINTISISVDSPSTGKSSNVEKTIVAEFLPPTINVYVPETVYSSTVQISGNINDILDNSPIVEVNGESVFVNSSGNWNANVQLSEGVNSISITGRNKYGKMTTIDKIINYVK